MSKRQIIAWLSESELPHDVIDANRWMIQLGHEHCDYDVTITNRGDWFSFAADLTGDVKGRQRDKFYHHLFSLNGKLNGVHIALEEGRFILVRDEYSDNIISNKVNFFRSLATFHEAHQSIYLRMLNVADSLDITLDE